MLLLSTIYTQIKNQINQADYILVGAGHGLSQSAGVDYDNQACFAQTFPDLKANGFNCAQDLWRTQQKHREKQLYYQLQYAQKARFSKTPNAVYEQLMALLSDKNYFIVTTNQDGWFIRSGAQHQRIYTPQGDLSRLQCSKNCENRTFATLPILKKLDGLPMKNLLICPNCQSPLKLNCYEDKSFCQTPYEDQARRYYSFINTSVKSRLLLIKLGVGYTTPDIIRFPFEHILGNHPNAYMIRINTNHPLAVEENAHKVLSVGEDIGTVLAKLG